MQYSLYTVSVANGSANVVGDPNTKFLTNVAPGNAFHIKNDPARYTVATVVDDTNLTLSSAYQGTTNAYAQYQITTGYTANQGLTEIDTGDKDWPIHLTQGVIRKVDSLLAGVSKVAAASATTGSISIPAGSLSGVTLTPTGACTLSVQGTGMPGQEFTLFVTTSGTTSRTLTFSTGFKATGTLATGSVSGKCFAVTFRTPDGTTWWEVSRTAAM